MRSSYTGSSTSSYNLQDVWNRACWIAMGFSDDEYDLDEDSWELIDTTTTCNTATSSNEVITTSTTTSFQVINLMPSSMYDGEDNDQNEMLQENGSKDPFMNMAQQLQCNIDTMRNWLHQKQLIYIQLTTSDSEASLIQSTITSFTATTANEIESLHQIVRNNPTTTSQQAQPPQQSQIQQHSSGIVQILMMELQDTIAIPFQQLTKLRHRTAVQIYQNPIQCRMYIPPPKKSKKEKDTTLDLLGLDDDDNDDDDDDYKDDDNTTIGTTKINDQRFIPTRPSHRLHQDFYSTYYEHKNNDVNAPFTMMKQRPISIFITSSSSGSVVLSPSSLSTTTKENSIPQPGKVHDNAPSNKNNHMDFTTNNTLDNEYESTTAAMLQQESILLQMKTNNDLDSVQQMEQTMLDITTLLSQFTNLVVEQQDNIQTIYDTTATTHDNIQKGTENLHEAKVRVQSSKHYMATMIFSMGIILLLFHWLRP